MSKKTKITPELIKKAKKVFEEARKSTIMTGEGLSRAELRALERAKLVRKMTIFGKIKYAVSTGTKSYVWSWIGD